MPYERSFLKPLYRVFHLAPSGGIVRAEVIEAADDDDAVLRIHAMAVDHVCELWDRARFVATVPPPDAAPHDLSGEAPGHAAAKPAC